MVSKVVALGPPKEAALYFDHIAPIDFAPFSIRLGDEVSEPWEASSDLTIPFDDPILSEKIVENILPVPGALNFYREQARMVSSAGVKYVLVHAARRNVLDRFVETSEFKNFLIRQLQFGISVEKIILEAQDFDRGLGEIYSDVGLSTWKLIEGIGFSRANSWTPIADKATPADSANEGFDYAVTLSNLRLVDPTKISWEQILEFRNDERSRERLRKFRILFNEEYRGQPFSYVEDKLLQSLEEHEEAAKIWGFELVDRSFSILGSIEKILPTLLASGATAIAGAPLGAVAAIGTILPIGSIGLEIGRYIKEKDKLANGPYSYLSDLRKL